MKKHIFLFLSLALGILMACGGKDPVPGTDPDGPEGPTAAEYKVAVIFPKSEWDILKPAVEWAKEDAEKGNPGVVLSLEWIDENGADIAQKVKDVTHDNSYAAIIGPEYSSSARLVARESLSYRMPVLMPMVTSTEFHRIYAETNKVNPNIFCLAQSDVTQCEAIIAKARQMGIQSLYMLFPCNLDGTTNDYVSSFEQNFVFLCKEAGIPDFDYYAYNSRLTFDNWLSALLEMHQKDGKKMGLFIIPSSNEEMLQMDRALQPYKAQKDIWPVFCSDIAHVPQLESQLKAGPYEGFSLGATEAFKQAWTSRFGTALPGGYAQLYDCVRMVAHAAAKVEDGGAKTVREALESFVFSGNSYSGVSGTIHFGKDAPIAPEEVIYQNWRFSDGKFSVLASAPHNLDKGWDWSAARIDDYEDASDEPDYKPLKDHFAFVVATSTGWSNYRHQADALAMYQMLKDFGYTDDQIILIMEDDVAGHALNPTPGEIRVVPGGPDLRKGAIVDYKLHDLTPEDLKAIFAGTPTEKTPVVIKGSEQTNVLAFWAGHGVRNYELKWGEGIITFDQFSSMLLDAQPNFRKMFFVMDTCYSGSVAGSFDEPGLLFLCSASWGEPSHADVYDGQYGTYLSNGFTRAFRSAVEANPKITLIDLYKEVARETTGSHAGVYNYWYYGSLYRSTFEEYTIKQ